MDYRWAYEALSKAVWQYEKTNNDAYVRLMLAVREIEEKLGQRPVPPIQWPLNNGEADK